MHSLSFQTKVSEKRMKRNRCCLYCFVFSELLLLLLCESFLCFSSTSTPDLLSPIRKRRPFLKKRKTKKEKKSFALYSEQKKNSPQENERKRRRSTRERGMREQEPDKKKKKSDSYRSNVMKSFLFFCDNSRSENKRVCSLLSLSGGKNKVKTKEKKTKKSVSHHFPEEKKEDEAKNSGRR